MILCAICKKPIRTTEIVAKIGDRFVHLDHHGVRDQITSPEQLKAGSCLQLEYRQYPSTCR